jgi:NAD(P)-dependent dehydrogenase (short-subunit alcohol dehydrogenase family)
MSLAPRAIVTGVSSGIGAAIAQRLLRDGWAVTGISRSVPAKGVEHVSLDLARAGGEEIRAALADVLATALVHAAGVLRVGELGALDINAGAAMWRLHVEAALQRDTERRRQRREVHEGRLALTNSYPVALGLARRSRSQTPEG